MLPAFFLLLRVAKIMKIPLFVGIKLYLLALLGKFNLETFQF